MVSRKAGDGIGAFQIRKTEHQFRKNHNPQTLEKGFIEVTGFGYSGTTVARTFQAKISAEEYAANQLGAMQSTILNFSTLNFVKQILKNNPETLHDLHELEEMVQKLKEEE